MGFAGRAGQVGVTTSPVCELIERTSTTNHFITFSYNSQENDVENSAHLRGGIGSGLMTSVEGRNTLVNERLKARAIREASREAVEMDPEQLKRNMYDAVSILILSGSLAFLTLCCAI